MSISHEFAGDLIEISQRFLLALVFGSMIDLGWIDFLEAERTVNCLQLVEAVRAHFSHLRWFLFDRRDHVRDQKEW
jgi:hypothetical protein